jgi:hypothetical protein
MTIDADYQNKIHKKSALRRIFCFELPTTVLRGQQLLAGPERIERSTAVLETAVLPLN